MDNQYVYLCTSPVVDAVKAGRWSGTEKALLSRYKTYYGSNTTLHTFVCKYSRQLEIEFSVKFAKFNISNELFVKSGTALNQYIDFFKQTTIDYKCYGELEANDGEVFITFQGKDKLYISCFKLFELPRDWQLCNGDQITCSNLPFNIFDHTLYLKVIDCIKSKKIEFRDFEAVLGRYDMLWFAVWVKSKQFIAEVLSYDTFYYINDVIYNTVDCHCPTVHEAFEIYNGFSALDDPAVFEGRLHSSKRFLQHPSLGIKVQGDF